MDSTRIETLPVDVIYELLSDPTLSDMDVYNFIQAYKHFKRIKLIGYKAARHRISKVTRHTTTLSYPVLMELLSASTNKQYARLLASSHKDITDYLRGILSDTDMYDVMMLSDNDTVFANHLPNVINDYLFEDIINNYPHSYKILKYLLRHYIKVEYADADDISNIGIIAAEANNVNMLKIIINSYVSDVDYDSDYAITAAENNAYDVIVYLIEERHVDPQEILSDEDIMVDVEPNIKDYLYMNVSYHDSKRRRRT